jgi:hypothetical protein
MRRPALAVMAVAALVAVTGCRSGGGTGAAARPATLPQFTTPCASPSASPSPSPQPLQTKLAWRAEELPGGAVRMTVGDVAAAPKAPRAVRTVDYRAPGSRSECDDTRIIKVRGWWCATTVAPVAEQGAIVLGGARPRARVHSAGFATRCAGRHPRIRQHFEVQRDSWSGWRDYSERAHTAWTRAQRQSHGRVSTPCPRGRVGTYDYRLAVAVEVEGIRADDSTAASAQIRTDCGTGVS